MNIITSSTPMREKPAIDSNLETECLFGETVEIQEEKFEWVFCRLLTDNYKGWVKKDDLGELPKPTHRVNAIRTFVYEARDPKSYCIGYLPMGSNLTVKKKFNEWAEIYVYLNKKIKTAFIPNQDVVDLSYKSKDWVKNAEKLLNTPYKWGGRDTIGIDCSALIQISYATSGNKIPRNTSDQINVKKSIMKSYEEIDRGVVVFWKGHVGLMIDKINCIHANAFTMKTSVELLSNIEARMGKKNRIIKMINLME